MGSSLGTAETVRHPDDGPEFPDRLETRTVGYDVLGVGLTLTSNVPQVLDLIDATYAAFRVPGTSRSDAMPAAPERPPAAEFRLIDAGDDGYRIESPVGRSALVRSPGDGAIAILEAMVGAVVAGLHRQGLLAVHAGAVSGPRGAVVVAGRSGQGKSTLVLGLVRRGFGLLSDELAILDPSDGRVHPYGRAIHVRPATLGLIPELAPIASRPLITLGGGTEWSVAPAEAAGLLGGRLGEALPLAAVVLLDGQPDPVAQPRLRDEFPAVAAIELLRSTWAASADFSGTLEAVGGMLAGVPCLRLTVGQFDATVDALVARLGSADG